MLTTLRKIGNSRGILIPAAILASCQIEDQVDLQLQDGLIVIKPVRRLVRDGWFTPPVSELSQRQAAAQAAESEAWSAAPLADDGEWVW